MHTLFLANKTVQGVLTMFNQISANSLRCFNVV